MDKEEKLKKIINCFDKWMKVRESGYSISDYLQKKNIQTAGIYGYGKLGRHLLRELVDNGIEVKWLMDEKNISARIPCAYIEPCCSKIPLDVDIIINTALGAVEEIEKKFFDLEFYNIVTIDELLKETGYQIMS